ncbi:MAG: hypothetical protein MJA27_12845 [Pseudanabaenales cyanobacterium]|nr:hypothetical protein [Pseudanabaenales cyanobacterium]
MTVFFLYPLCLSPSLGERLKKSLKPKSKGTKRIWVIAQDNGPIHTSKAVQAKWPE